MTAALIALCGVVLAQFVLYTNNRSQQGLQRATMEQQQKQHEAQLTATAAIERGKHRRQMEIDAMVAAYAAASRMVGAYRELLAAIDDAAQEQFTVSGRVPQDTERIVVVRQACRLALAESDTAAGMLSVLGFTGAYGGMTALRDAVTDSLLSSRDGRPDETAVDLIVASQKGLIAELHAVRHVVFDGDDG
jgi:hypothetical protein